MRSFIYCRVSTREQSTEEHYSLDNQEQRCRDYITMKKWQAATVRKDVASGKNDNREGFQQLLADIKGRRIDVVIVYRLDRLSRNVRDIYDFLDSIRQYDVAFVSVTEGFDTTTAMGRAMLGVAAVFAQLTREMISENCKDGLLRRAEAGLFNGNKSGMFGYSYSKDMRSLIVCEEEAVVVRQIYGWFTEQKWGASKIARMLNVKGIRTKSGVQWQRTSVSIVINNPVYCGLIRANGGLVDGRHDAIISREQYQEARDISQARVKYPTASQQSRHLLSGIVTCGKCDRRLVAHHLNSKAKNGTDKVYRYVTYYHKRTVEVGDKECPGISKSARKLEDAVIDQIAAVSLSGDLERLVVEEIKSRRTVGVASLTHQRDKLLLERNEIGAKFSQWADRLDAGKIDEEQFALQNKRLLDRKRELQTTLDKLDRELAEHEDIEVSLAEAQAILRDFPRIWAALEHEERRETLRLLIEYMRVYQSHAELKLLFLDPIRIPLQFKRGVEVKSPKAVSTIRQDR
jgi:site-specific DNA recombinase